LTDVNLFNTIFVILDFNKKVVFKKMISDKIYFKNLRLGIVNILAFLYAALKFRDKRMHKIVWATFKRQIAVYLFKQRTLEYVEKHRKGNCVSCGVCCQYIRRCPYLTSENTCVINSKKHFICRVYPISNADVQLVSKVSDKKCGYYFD
jgi:hypothetical protein